MENINIWFYTFSTSAQVLAALVGLFSVFVIYKIQSLSNVYDDIRGAVIKLLSEYLSNDNYKLGEPEKFEDITFWNDKKLSDVFNKIVIKHEELPRDKRQHFNVGSAPILIFQYNADKTTAKVFEELVKQRQNIFNGLILVLILNMTTIFYDIVCLSFSREFNYSIYCIYINLILVFISLIVISYKTFVIGNK